MVKGYDTLLNVIVLLNCKLKNNNQGKENYRVDDAISKQSKPLLPLESVRSFYFARVSSANLI